MAIERFRKTISRLTAALRRPERQPWRVVDDEPGQGHFEIAVENAKCRRFMTVPAVDFPFDNGVAKFKYTQFQLATGEPVIAYRFGRHGCCNVQVNLDILAVTKMTEFNPEPRTIPPINHLQPFLLLDGSSDGVSHKIEIEGRTIANQSIKATVFFVPSR